MRRYLLLVISAMLVVSLAIPFIAHAEAPDMTPPWADQLDEGDTWSEFDGLTAYREYAELFDEYTYANPDEEIGDMTYYVYDPTKHGFPKGETYPVVLWFHGAGNASLGRDAISGGGASGMASEAHQKELGGMYIVCPLANEDTVGIWLAGNYEASVKGILDEVIEREGITGERLLAGTSAGGAMVDKYLEAYSDEISVVFWMSTWLPTPEKVKEYSDKGIIMWFETGAHDEVISNEMSFGGEGNNVAYDDIENFEYTIFDWIRNGDGKVASLNFGVQQGQHCSCAQANRNFILDDGTPDDPAHPEGLTGFFRDALAKVRAR